MPKRSTFKVYPGDYILSYGNQANRAVFGNIICKYFKIKTATEIFVEDLGKLFESTLLCCVVHFASRIPPRCEHWFSLYNVTIQTTPSWIVNLSSFARQLYKKDIRNFSLLWKLKQSRINPK